MRVVRDLDHVRGPTSTGSASHRELRRSSPVARLRRFPQASSTADAPQGENGDPSRRTATVSNEQIAGLLDRVAERLEEQHANHFRVDAYRLGAHVVALYAGSIQQLALDEGRQGLEHIPHIGKSLAACIEEIAHTGRLHLLERVEGRSSPEAVLAQVPGIGEKLAKRIHRELHVETLQGLQAAANDGRLEGLPGFGRRRTAAVRAILASMLARRSRRAPSRFAPSSTRPQPSSPATVVWPGVDVLLDVDRHYRQLAKGGTLPCIAPTRNNPERESWLPILHTEVAGWHFTALFSNSDRAHELEKTDDWVVLHYERDGHENQSTVVTELTGRLAGLRVVRGQEPSCARLYAQSTAQDGPAAAERPSS